ncbi:uncharacterized protein BP5553_03788 [Venustampulla echinocandica]|uniref:Peroxin 11C n=1 Tax=Venustampulla echinocandica TaxID=2656787 RepID=A0A370TVF4_9HELO|nr:uncharacterized protein BP5553_03788 [Venustampulla echinocandica]RDL39448.1 hypothetical protein BP5553_03788 [Venustampulla echinocandica]
MSKVNDLPPPETPPSGATSPPKPSDVTPLPPSVSNHTPSIQNLVAWAPLYLSKTDRVINHLSALLSSPSGTDRLLCTLGYTSLLTSTVATSISQRQLHTRARSIIEKAFALPANTTVIINASELKIPGSRLLVAGKRLKALNGLISDFRIFVRLWGLVGLWGWGKSVLLRIHKERNKGSPMEKDDESSDRVGTGIEAAQVLVNILYQFLENGAYLSSKGVLGWNTEKQNWAWIWSSRFWMTHVGLDFIRLAREWSKKGKDAEEQEKLIWKWRREMVVNAAYAPLTLHWSLEKGLVGDFWVGVFGSIAGLGGLREAWRVTGAGI